VDNSPDHASKEQDRLPAAWQPLTFRGVAAFAHAPFGRGFSLQVLVAVVAAASVVWQVNTAWAPVIQQAIGQLPDEGRIENGKLQWTQATSLVLAQNLFLVLSVDLDEPEIVNQASDVRCTFGRTRLYCGSLLGQVSIPYSTRRVWPFNRTELEPWWGAWKPIILGIVGFTVLIGLLLVWQMLAWFYSPLVRLIGFLLDRDLNWRRSRKLAGAALMPGALLFSAGIIAYGWQQVNLLGLLLAMAVHWAIGWVYLVLSPFWLPRANTMPRRADNPFQPRRAAKARPLLPDKTVDSDSLPARPPRADTRGKPSNPFRE
jgi:hypothetical protein